MSSDVVVRRSSAGRIFLALLFGIVLGAVLAVVVLATDLLPFGDGDLDPDTAGAAETATPTAEPTAASGDVPPSCLAAAEHNATVSTALDEVAIGVRDQDALAVESALDAIADIKPDMDAASAECRELAGAAP